MLMNQTLTGSTSLIVEQHYRRCRHAWLMPATFTQHTDDPGTLIVLMQVGHDLRTLAVPTEVALFTASTARNRMELMQSVSTLC